MRGGVREPLEVVAKAVRRSTPNSAEVALVDADVASAWMQTSYMVIADTEPWARAADTSRLDRSRHSPTCTTWND
jgi:hypothetical protein